MNDKSEQVHFIMHFTNLVKRAARIWTNANIYVTYILEVKPICHQSWNSPYPLVIGNASLSLRPCDSDVM